jgi:glycosyltransferase involved in cell wall biosynthesis
VEPRKNITALLDVMVLLHQQFGERTPACVLVGREGWKSDEVHRRLPALKARGIRVKWIRHLPDTEISAVYRGALFTVVPSLSEGWGLPVQESLAQGVPCIASRAGGLPEAGGDLARYFDPLAPDELAMAMAHWIAEPASLAQERARVRQRLAVRSPLVSWDRAGAVVLRLA